jgi:hypothetical protein
MVSQRLEIPDRFMKIQNKYGISETITIKNSSYKHRGKMWESVYKYIEPRSSRGKQTVLNRRHCTYMIIERHLDHAVIHEMLNIEPEQCMLMDFYRDIIEHRMNRLYR